MIWHFYTNATMQQLILYTFYSALSRVFLRIFQIYPVFFRFLLLSLGFSPFLWIRFIFYSGRVQMSIIKNLTDSESWQDIF